MKKLLKIFSRKSKLRSTSDKHLKDSSVIPLSDNKSERSTRVQEHEETDRAGESSEHKTPSSSTKDPGGNIAAPSVTEVDAFTAVEPSTSQNASGPVQEQNPENSVTSVTDVRSRTYASIHSSDVETSTSVSSHNASTQTSEVESNMNRYRKLFNGAMLSLSRRATEFFDLFNRLNPEAPNKKVPSGKGRHRKSLDSAVYKLSRETKGLFGILKKHNPGAAPEKSTFYLPTPTEVTIGGLPGPFTPDIHTRTAQGLGVWTLPSTYTSEEDSMSESSSPAKSPLFHAVLNAEEASEKSTFYLPTPTQAAIWRLSEPPTLDTRKRTILKHGVQVLPHTSTPRQNNTSESSSHTESSFLNAVLDAGAQYQEAGSKEQTEAQPLHFPIERGHMTQREQNLSLSSAQSIPETSGTVQRKASNISSISSDSIKFYSTSNLVGTSAGLAEILCSSLNSGRKLRPTRSNTSQSTESSAHTSISSDTSMSSIESDNKSTTSTPSYASMTSSISINSDQLLSDRTPLKKSISVPFPEDRGSATQNAGQSSFDTPTKRNPGSITRSGRTMVTERPKYLSSSTYSDGSSSIGLNGKSRSPVRRSEHITKRPLSSSNSGSTKVAAPTPTGKPAVPPKPKFLYSSLPSIHSPTSKLYNRASSNNVSMPEQQRSSSAPTTLRKPTFSTGSEGICKRILSAYTTPADNGLSFAKGDHVASIPSLGNALRSFAPSRSNATESLQRISNDLRKSPVREGVSTPNSAVNRENKSFVEAISDRRSSSPKGAGRVKALIGIFEEKSGSLKNQGHFTSKVGSSSQGIVSASPRGRL